MSLVCFHYIFSGFLKSIYFVDLKHSFMQNQMYHITLQWMRARNPTLLGPRDALKQFCDAASKRIIFF